MRIERIKVWSGWLRLSHLAILVASLVLLASGWLIRYAPTLSLDAAEVHSLGAALLIFGLGVRLALFARARPLESLAQLWPGRQDLRMALETLRCYLTLGKLPLPRWYAHNPLWKPLYLLFYLLLLTLVFSGWLRHQHPLLAGLSLPDIHVAAALVLAWWSGLHLLAVIWHDYYGSATDASSIINGHRLFTVERPPAQSIDPGETVIRLDQIGRLNK